MTNKLIDFVNKYIKCKVDFDGVYGAQCVDLFRQYAREVLAIDEHTGAVNGAKDLYEKYNDLPKEKQYFMRISAGVSSIAAPGDVAVFGATSTNIYGHVAIVLEDTGIGQLILFEQDGFKQDGAKIVMRDKRNLLGYLRKWEC